MNLILDTHALVWFGEGNPKFSRKVLKAMADPDIALCVSAVTAWEYVDLYRRGRLPEATEFAPLHERMAFIILDLPAELWRVAAALPDIHRDPVDRMMIAHAIALDLTLVTADRKIRSYPVETLW